MVLSMVRRLSDLGHPTVVADNRVQRRIADVDLAGLMAGDAVINGCLIGCLVGRVLVGIAQDRILPGQGGDGAVMEVIHACACFCGLRHHYRYTCICIRAGLSVPVT